MMADGTSIDLVQGGSAMAMTALTKNPFLGLVTGIAVRYIGQFFFPGIFLL
jgi:hypothetical protein